AALRFELTLNVTETEFEFEMYTFGIAWESFPQNHCSSGDCFSREMICIKLRRQHSLPLNDFWQCGFDSSDTSISSSSKLEEMCESDYRKPLAKPPSAHT